MYIVEGNIGAGKSTFLKMIEQHVPQIEIALEPLHNWQKNVYGQSLLANFYNDPSRWSYSLETFAMMCRVREHLIEQKNTNKYRLLERSIYSGHYCFVKTGYSNGFMSEIEWNLYNDWFNFLIPEKCLVPRGFIYLKVEPKNAYDRIKKRNRHEEQGITLAYLEQIHACHEQFLIEKKDILPNLAQVPVLILDVNKDFEKDRSSFADHVDFLKTFMDIVD